MLADLLAERYSKALLRAAQAEKALDAVGPQAALLADVLRKPGSEAFLADPLAEPSAKVEALASAFGGALHPVLAAFLAEVFGNRRERYLPAMLDAFALGLDAAEGRLRAALGTARALKPAELARLGEALGRRLKRTVILEPYTDAALLGGAVLRLGDTVYDGSLRGGLRRLERRLAAEPPAPKAKPKPEPAAKPGPAAKAAPKKAKAPSKAAPKKTKPSPKRVKAVPKKAKAAAKAAPKKRA